MNLKEILKSEHAGFMGRSHWLQTNAIFLSLWLVPVSTPFLGDFAKSYLAEINTSVLFLILNFMVLGGGSLLPDLDSSPLEEGNSTAIQQLGFLGMALSTIEITIAHVVWSVFHLKGDDKPKSGHRLIWHTLIVPLGFYFLAMNQFPKGSTSTIAKDVIKDLSLTNIMQNLSVLFILFMLSISIYIGLNMLVYRVFKLIGMQRYVNIVCWIGFGVGMFMMLNMPFSQVRLLSLTLALSYGLHCIEDVLTQGSSPIAFPVPLPKHGKFQLWFKGFIPYKLSIQTGGLENTILDYIMIGVDIFLVWLIFIK